MCFFSVIIPVYNAEKYLNRCIESVLNQTFENFEIILIDDSSQDNSRSICESYLKKDRRVRFQTIQHSGASVARNIGLNIANGKYFLFLDSDDYFAKEFLEYIYYDIKDQEPDICYMRYHYVVKADGEICINTLFQMKDERAYITSKGEFLKIVTTDGNVMPASTWTIVVNGNYLKENKIFFDSNLVWSEDTDFSFQLFTKARKITWCNFCGYYYYIGNTESVSKKITWNKALGRMYVYKKWSEYFINDGDAIQIFDEKCRERMVQQLLKEYCEILFRYTELPTNEEIQKMYRILKKERKFWKKTRCDNYRIYVKWGLTVGTLIQQLKKKIKNYLIHR